MNRDYTTGKHEKIVFFTGKEIEHTPAYNKETLFVAGVHQVEIIESRLDTLNIEHLFFGANHSFLPKTADDWKQWEDMILYFLVEDYMCSLDIPVAVADQFYCSDLLKYPKFIPQIRVPLPHIKSWNYNTMIKLDDTDFNHSNPGVWTHSLHNLMDRECFTSWDEYSRDTIID